MCGIIGAAGALTIKEENMVKTLLQLDTIRGPHSTGLFGRHTDGDETILKKTGTPFELALYRDWGQFWGGSFNVIIGHNRYATSGAINNVTAHPFNYGDISGVHNGTLGKVGQGSWKTQLDDGYTFDVDSEALYHHMSKNGIDDTVKRLDGAFALVWHDAKDGTINMTRNKERTLFFTHSEDGKTIFWASEDWMLVVAAAKHGVKINKPAMLKENILYSIPIEQAIASKCGQLGGEVRDLEQYKYTWKGQHTGKKQLPSTTNTGKKQTGSTVHGTNTTTTGNTNIVSLKDKKLATDLADIVGETILFTVDGVDHDTACGLEYLDCTALVDECPVNEVRYYYQASGEAAALEMLDTDVVYAAKVRHFRVSGTCAYVTVDPRTVVPYITSAGRQEVKK